MMRPIRRLFDLLLCALCLWAAWYHTPPGAIARTVLARLFGTKAAGPPLLSYYGAGVHAPLQRQRDERPAVGRDDPVDQGQDPAQRVDDRVEKGVGGEEHGCSGGLSMGDRVVTARVPGSAPAEPAHGQRTAAQDTVFLDRFGRVLRAGGREATGGRENR